MGKQSNDDVAYWTTPPEVVATWRTEGIAVENYVTGSQQIVTADVLNLLGFCHVPRTAEQIAEHLGLTSQVSDELQGFIDELNSAGLLTASKDHNRGSLSGTAWEDWGPEAQYFHWTTKDAPYLESDETRELYGGDLGALEQPALFKTYPEAPTIHLPRLLDLGAAPYGDVVRDRRTYRRFTEDAVGLESLSALLAWTFGPTRFIDAEVFGTLPFRAYANAGARSEVETYVNVSRVEGLEAGLYHYNQLEHGLEYLAESLTEEDLEYLSYHQPMVSKAPVVMFLSAKVQRLSHKYKHPRSLRAMYIDAGQVGQLFAMNSTALGLGPTQTAAFRDTEVDLDLSWCC